MPLANVFEPSLGKSLRILDRQPQAGRATDVDGWPLPAVVRRTQYIRNEDRFASKIESTQQHSAGLVRQATRSVCAQDALHRGVENNSPSSERHFNRSDNGYVESIDRAIWVCSPDRKRAGGVAEESTNCPAGNGGVEGNVVLGHDRAQIAAGIRVAHRLIAAHQMRMQFLIFKNCPVIHHFQLIQSDTAVFRFGEDHEIGARWIEECRYSSSSGKSAGKLASNGYACRTVDYDPRALERCF